MTDSARAAGRPATLIWILALLGALAATVLPAASAAAGLAVPEVAAVPAVASPGVQAAVDGDETVEVTLYYGAECPKCCLLYTSDAADDLLCVDLGGRRIIKNK